MLSKLKIRSRLILGFSIVLFFMLILIVLAFEAMKNANSNIEKIVKVENVRTQLANNMIDHTREESITIQNILLDQSRTNELLTKITKIRVNYNADYKNFIGLINKKDSKTLTLITKINSSKNESKELNNQVVEIAIAGKNNEAIVFMNSKANPQESQ